MYKPALTAGALFAAIALILGAFGAHALKAIMPADQLLVYETAVRYQFYHSFALLISGIVYASFPFKSIRTATVFFITGIVFFSGSLYAMTLLSTKGISLGPIGIITPIGGLFFIIGWLMLAAAFMRKKISCLLTPLHCLILLHQKVLNEICRADTCPPGRYPFP